MTKLIGARIPRRAILGAALLVALLLPSAVPGQSVPLDAPWQIEGVELAVESWAEGSVDGVQVIVVGLGRAPDLQSPDVGGAAPAGDELEWVTIIGTEGFAHASRLSIERRCEFLCEIGGSEECHWVGRYNTHSPLRGVGTVLAAIPGRLDLTVYTPVLPDDGENLMARLTLPRAKETPSLLWSDLDGDVGLAVAEWDQGAGRLAGTLVTPYGNQALAADGCRSRAYEWLLAIDCGHFSVLASGGGPLVVSLADYNTPKVEPLARFDYAGSRHYIVRLGEKAQDVIGLVSGEPAGWRARFRPRDWASLC